MTSIDRDRLRKLAAYYSQGDMGMLSGLSWGEVLALLDTLTRAEAERDAQTVQCHYWKALHERSEARLQAQKAAHADQIKYWQGEARIHRRRADDMEDNTLRAQSNTRAMEERARRAEARTRVVRDVLGHLDPHAARLLREALDGDA